MTKNELIEGGWIDKYVLGLTSEQESSEVERLASFYPEIQDQINQSRSRICRKFNRNLTQPALRHSLLTKRRILVGSAITVISVLAGFMFVCKEHFSLRKDYHSKCEKLEQEHAKVEQLSSHSKLAEERSSFLNSNTTNRIKVKGCDATPDAEVLLYQCKLSGKMMLQVVDLPVLSSGHRYEVWAQNPDSLDRMIGILQSPIKYDSMYMLDKAKDYSSFQITDVDPVSNFSEPVCMATVSR